MLSAIWQSVFIPHTFAKKNRYASMIIEQWGWIFILLRWGYYSIFFTFFRNYDREWKPFVVPPFGLNITTYAFFQRIFAPLFGFFLMAFMAVCVRLFLSAVKKDISFFKLLNILGITFFLPFVVLQPLDWLTVAVSEWNAAIIIPLHSAALIWESIAAMSIINNIAKLLTYQNVAMVLILVVTWILPCAIVWR